MTLSAPAPLWAGRTLALIGIVLVSVNLRTAATSLSSIIAVVGVDIPLDALRLGVIGMLPPILFALAGVTAPRLAHRWGLERFVIIAMTVMVAGLVARAFAGEYLVLFLGSFFALAAAGVGNILLPPLVKRYFPDRISLLTALYASGVAVGTTLPPAFAVPIANVGGWRVSLGVWALMALASLIPWVFLLASSRKRVPAAVASGLDAAPEVEAPSAVMVGRVWHSRIAWSIALVFALTSFQAYSLFAWLPRLLVDHVGVSEIEGGALLAFWGVMAIASSIVAPLLASRLRNVGWILYIGAAGFVAGYLGLLVAPGVSPWLWVALCGVGQIVFPAALTFINLRTRTHSGAIALSGFAQGVGYTIAALGPLLVGMLHDMTGGWEASLVLLAAAALVMVYFGYVLRVPRYVEDETARYSER